MKKITLFMFLLVASFNAKAQSTIFEDSFESYTNFAITGIGGWTLVDLDLGTSSFIIPVPAQYPNRGESKSWQIINPALTTPPFVATTTLNWNARTGTQSIVCFGKELPSPVVNDDWLISPQTALGTVNTVSFWAKASSTAFPAEKFNVYISNTTTAIASFVKISPAPVVTTASPGLVWREYTYTIPASYDNTAVYLAVQCVSDDQWSLVIDDFKVTGTVACPAPSAGTSVVTGLSAALSWTSAGGFNVSEVKVQLAGAGTPAVANNTGVAVSGTTYTATGLTIDTNYEFWVRDECTDGVLFSAWKGPFLFNTVTIPNCVTLVAPANAAPAVVSTAPIPLSWTAATTGAPAASYDVYVGTTAVLTTLTANVTTLTYNFTGALFGTTYFWKVVAKNAGGSAIGCTNFTFTTAPLLLPNCVTLVAPANAAPAVSVLAPIVFSWTAATTGGAAASYDVFLDTNANPTTLASNVTTLTYTRTGLAGLTTYFWKVVAKNATGSAVGCTSVFSFTTGANPFTPYCGPVFYTFALEPITFVKFAGIDKTYPNTVVPAETAVHHKFYTDVATVAQGSTNVIELKGMTAGNFPNRLVVFVDWNQNGVLNDAGEVYFDTTPLIITNSTGLPAVAPTTGNIVVPATATLGNTRMRIKKQFGTATPLDPCLGTFFGEIHDYQVTVTPQLANSTFDNSKFVSHPNPVIDIFTVSYNKNITNISVVNVLGQELISRTNADVEAKIDMSSLAAGNYLVKLTSDNEVKTIKVVKK